MRGRGVALLVGMKAGEARASAAQQQQAQAQAAQQQAYEQGKQEARQQAPAAPAPSAAPASGDLTAQLQNLAKMHDQGLLTDEEYAVAKKKLLG